jgi:hypothetical protein
MPAAMHMMMMRYWQYHHSPAHLPIIRSSDQGTASRCQARRPQGLPQVRQQGTRQAIGFNRYRLFIA